MKVYEILKRQVDNERTLLIGLVNMTNTPVGRRAYASQTARYVRAYKAYAEFTRRSLSR